MKLKMTVMLVAIVIANIALGQNTSTTQKPMDDEFSTKGLRISLLRPELDIKSKSRFRGRTGEGSVEISNSTGLAVGYAHLPVQRLGFTTNLAVLELKEDSSTTLVRADGSLGYAFNKNVNLKGGINLMKVTSEDDFAEFEPGFGGQFSVGVQMTKNFGLELGYTEMNTSGRANRFKDFEFELKVSGFEIGLTGTF